MKSAVQLGDGISQVPDCKYLDYNATTPDRPEVIQAVIPYLSEFGNPSSSHPYGIISRAAIESARSSVARLIHADPDEIYFTSSGTESDNWAIWGSISLYKKNNPNDIPHVVTSKIEHPAILKKLESLRQLGLLEFTAVDVDSQAMVNPDEVVGAIRRNTCLVSIMHSNNEVGSIQPIKEISQLIFRKNKDIVFHSDGAQSVGKVSVNVKELGVDMFSIVGHKFGAPKGVAALFVRKGVHIEPFFCGGGQERGLRSGTENVALIVGLGKASEIALNFLELHHQYMREMRDLLEKSLRQEINASKLRVNGPSASSLKLPNTLSISVRGIKSSVVLSNISRKVAASAGSACHSDNNFHISGIISAMGLPEEWAHGTFRFSVGWFTTKEEILMAAKIISDEIHKMIQ